MWRAVTGCTNFPRTFKKLNLVLALSCPAEVERPPRARGPWSDVGQRGAESHPAFGFLIPILRTYLRTYAWRWSRCLGRCHRAPLLPCSFLPKGGPHKGTTSDQTGYLAIQRVPWGHLNRALPAPYSPGSALSVENHCFGPWVGQLVFKVPQASTARHPFPASLIFFVREMWPRLTA